MGTESDEKRKREDTRRVLFLQPNMRGEGEYERRRDDKSSKLMAD
jgi:hypothetical protein